MAVEEKIAQLENEIKVLKNEVQAVLLDLRDKYLEAENPFNKQSAPTPVATQQIVIGRESTPPSPPPPPVAATETGATEVARQDEDQDEYQGEDEPVERLGPHEVRATHRAKARRASPETSLRREPVMEHPAAVSSLNLLTVSALVHWMEKSVKRLGRPRTETIIDVSEMMGLLSPQLRQLLGKLINIQPDSTGGDASGRDYLDSLLEVTSLLGRDNTTETALLSVLPSENDHR
jgi:hypothetical protein